MARPKRNGKPGRDSAGLDLRKLKKELKLIPFGIQREKRFMDLLFSERNIVRTQTERDVLIELIDSTSKTVEVYQSRLHRYQVCFEQIKNGKTFDNGLLLPDELHSLANMPESELRSSGIGEEPDLRTGTHG